MKGAGRAVFVAILLLIAGVLNIIYGIAAVSNAHFFDNTQYVFSSLHTWGWITIVVGIIPIVLKYCCLYFKFDTSSILTCHPERSSRDPRARTSRRISSH